jgi:SPP1 gp7 family putative phage head morphogenesis protein
MATLRPIRASAALRVQYEKRLLALIDEMQRSILHWISASWRQNTPETIIYASDESPVAELQIAMTKLGRRWLKRFDALADSLADYFATSVKQRCDASLQADLRKAGMSIKFRMTPAMRDAFNAVRAENVNLIRSIATQHLTQVETLVMQSVSAGRDLKTLTNQLEKSYGVTRRRASLIARDQNNKATASMRRARETAVGVTEGIWMHSGGGKEPRPEHKAFSGHRFPLAEGHDFHDGFGAVLPGQAINCRCTWRAVLPGFD